MKKFLPTVISLLENSRISPIHRTGHFSEKNPPLQPFSFMKLLPRTLLSLAAAVACAISANAQSVTTDPVGFVTISAAPGTGSTRTTTVLSFPLLTSVSISGQTRGAITAVSSGTISNDSAQWEEGALSNPATPFFIQIKSGAAKGRTFLISSSTTNTSNTVSIDQSENLALSGVNIGDTYEIFAANTLSRIFGTPETTGILGGTSANVSDIVQLFVSGGWRQYYFNTDSGKWVRIGPGTVADNVVIRPDSGILYTRLAASQLDLTEIGRVPTTDRQALVNNSGITFVANSFPANLTLGSSNFASTPGWVSSTDANIADVVQILVSGGWRQYYNNGSNWIRIGPGVQSDNVGIPVGTSVILYKKGSASGVSVLSQVLPYTL